MTEFIHLHNHTHYSLMDGAASVKALVMAAKKQGMQSVAITDHGVMYGVPEFYRKCKEEGIKPIIGMEAYIVLDRSRSEKTKQEEVNGRKKKQYQHLILLAKNMTGYKNLIKLSTIGFLEGYYYRPRIDMEVLRQYSEGLICTSACLGGIVSHFIAENEPEKAEKIARDFKELFGDDFYLELQDHGLEKDKLILHAVPRLAKKLDIPLIATNDCHYISKDDALAHNVLVHLSDKTGEVDFRKLRYGTDQLYFKSAAEMKSLFREWPASIENTLAIDEKIDLNLDNKENHFPEFPIPDDSPAKDLDGYMEYLAHEGLKKKFHEITPEIKQRFDFEVATIRDMGFSGYFLIVQDFINAAKNMGIPVGPGRGSAAGSLVAYSLGITNVDPLKYNLLFERFLNPARRSMPDIDVDFADDQRGDVIDYVKRKYGDENVAQIITFSRLSSKQAIRDVARVLRLPLTMVDKITKVIPAKFGKVLSIDEALELPDLKWIRDSQEEDIKNLITFARKLENLNRNHSKHAAGVIITSKKVSDIVPLSRAEGQTEIVTQFNMKELESSGLLKMDFLGLRTLTIIRDAIKMVEEIHGVTINIDDIPDNDAKTFELFSRGQTTGIFQFESAPMREYLRKLRPESISDLAAMNALYRPGPMEFIDDFIDRKAGRKKIEYAHPLLEGILKETYGIIVYQEQVIQIANVIAGMSLADADLLRRAMGKKDLETMKKQEEKFIKGAVENNVPAHSAREIFANIDKFANYGFNKSHAVAYSVVAYQTAYLKANYTAEFLASNLSHEMKNKDKIAIFLEECRKLHIDVLPPDVNNPSVSFTLEEGSIRFGLSAVRNVGVNVVEEIIRTRKKIGRKFTSLFDFTSSVNTRTVNKRAMEGLVLAGAFDSIHPNRKALFESIETALDYGGRAQEYLEKITDSLFGASEDMMQISEPELRFTEDWSEAERLRQEREMLGFYLTGHPLRKYELEANSFSTIRLGEAGEMADEDAGGLERVVGVVTEVNVKLDKKGNKMAFLTINDLTGACECMMFSSVYEKCGEMLEPEKVFLFQGYTEKAGDNLKLRLENVIPVEASRDMLTKYIEIIIDRDNHTPEIISELEPVLKKHKGNLPVHIRLLSSGEYDDQKFRLRSITVSNNPGTIEEITRLVGENFVKLAVSKI
ncbi:MAG: DNA polymerase III subunit alpha [Ignavibacteriales bacterium]|nr:MAG: DNA polymerase III subunit alpha [Ignavibacteriales bacterium]